MRLIHHLERKKMNRRIFAGIEEIKRPAMKSQP